jgi:hypothetical protein
MKSRVSGTGIHIGDEMKKTDGEKTSYPEPPKWWAKCTCKAPDSIHSGYHDAFFCRNCYAWTEPVCSAVECDFCKDRPPYNIYAAKEDRKLISLDHLIDEDLESFFGKKFFKQAHQKRNHYGR